MRYSGTLLLLLFTLVNLSAQEVSSLPVSQLFSFKLQVDPENGFQLSRPFYLTGFNDRGYNDQPFARQDGTLFFSLRMEGKAQNDIHILDLDTRRRYNYTATRESEYSPYIDEASQSVMCVRVNENEKPAQKLWSYPLNRTDRGKCLWKTTMDVGYFCPLNDSVVAVFTLPENGQLHLVNIRKGTDEIIAQNIGRSLHRDDTGDLLFLHRVTPELQYLKRYEIQQKQARILTRLDPGIRDFTVYDGLIWYGKGSVIHVFDPDSGQHIQVADLAIYGIRSISRLTIENGQLILVNNPDL